MEAVKWLLKPDLSNCKYPSALYIPAKIILPEMVSGYFTICGRVVNLKRKEVHEMQKEPEKKGCCSCGSGKDKKDQADAKAFDPPAWCGDPCPKCKRACNKSYEHTGKHRCSEGHTWA